MSGSRKKKNRTGPLISAEAGKVRIFIVEDEIVIVKGLEDILERLGYQVCGFAASGEEAVKAIAATKPDLVLVDIYLKGDMDGISLAEIVSDTLAIPLIYITAYSNEEVLEKAKLTSPAGYIVKPFRESQLKVTMALALASYRKEQELREHLDRYRHTITALEQQLRESSVALDDSAEKLNLKTVHLDRLRQEVQEINKALLSLTSHTARMREELEVEVAVAVRTKLLPILKQLQADPEFKQYRIEFDMLSLHMNHLTDGLATKSVSPGSLTPTELRIAAFIKNDFSNDQIAQQLYLSPETVKTHRRNIRKKLGLHNSNKNLATYLKAQWAEPKSPFV